MKKVCLTILLLVFSSNILALMPKGVSWYSGSVDSAFALAKKENRPIFLYWGAIWCPPCNKMKTTIFSKPEFQKEAFKYISVYLDGDDSSAQSWGEKLGAKGYPTMLLFSSQGEEIMRMPIGGTAKSYTELLKTVLSKTRPIKEILTKVLAGKGDREDLVILSSYSWGQDHGRNLAESDQLKTFKELLVKIPSTYSLEKSKIFFQYLSYLLGDKKRKLDESEKVVLRKMFITYIDSSEILRNNLESITYSAVDIITLVIKKEEQSKIEKKILLTLNKLRDSGVLTLEEKFSSYYPNIMFSKAHKTKLDPRFKKLLADEVLAASKKKMDKFERQDVMSTAIYILKSSEQYDLAKKLSLKEIKKSISPFYFMLYLAGISEARNNIEEALAWREKAWQNATGSATRFQMGASYVRKMINYNSDENIIFSKANTLFKEILKSNQGLYGRNKRGAIKVLIAMKKWAKEKKLGKELSVFQEKIVLYCKSSSYKSNCLKQVTFID